MSRVESASGSKYSAHKEKAREPDLIAPVGTNYTPVGKVDIAALRKAPTPAAGAPKPALPGASRPTFGVPPAPSNRVVIGGNAPTDSWPAEEPVHSSPTPPASSRPPVISGNRPSPSVCPISLKSEVVTCRLIMMCLNIVFCHNPSCTGSLYGVKCPYEACRR
jgi:drebrin-like protein